MSAERRRQTRVREETFHCCACFYTDNIFLEDYHMHVRFQDEQQFRRDYEGILRRRGCRSEEHFKSILSKDSFLAPELLELVRFCTSKEADLEGMLNQIQSIADKRIYRFPVFSDEFCRLFIEEMEHFEQSELPKGRPNSMNNYGVLLNELGFDEWFIAPLREKYLQPVTSILYPDCGGKYLDSHKAFVVKYSLSEDLDLSSHYDNAEITINVSLGKEFAEGNLYFGDMRQVPANERSYVEIEHVVGQGLLHRGEHIHGALPITSGERWNLIVWMRSAAVRNQLCPMCNKTPQLVETLGYGDGFTQTRTLPSSETVDVCALI
ncbi:2-oxoglutarate and iron-dependent oxygenase domain-containing protein 2 isoform X2 [Ambystoma mexicanum]|uniref:2-oxoglutarate and iron-dependent oxygenase domain-containing protein 2 isoform X2 n=1 Tax=Ambystoma mexicanum TaxID=8296 RepID=UPI0037E88045